MSPKRPPSIMSDDERATDGARAFKESKSRPMQAVVPPHEFDDNPSTDVMEAAGYSRENILAVRAGRDTKQRLANVEAQNYDLVKGLGEVKGELGEVKGSLAGQDKVLASIQQSLTNLTQREHLRQVTVTEIEREKQVGAAQVNAAKQIDEVDQLQTARHEKADAARNRRERITKLVGAGCGVAALVLEILHQAGAF